MATLAALMPPAAPGAPSGTPASVVENVDQSLDVTFPISRKMHTAFPREGVLADDWRFCFDEPDGGAVCVPVSAADFERYGVGDWITLHQEVGHLATVRRHR